MIMKYIYSKLQITNKFVFNIHDNKFVFNINYGEAQQSYQQLQSLKMVIWECKKCNDDFVLEMCSSSKKFLEYKYK